MSVSRVLINGGGISGLSTALSLAKRGIPVKVFERRLANIKPKGSALILFPRSLSILHDLGLGSKLEPLLNPLHSVDIQDQHAEVMTAIDFEKLSESYGHFPSVIRHCDLHSVLLSAVANESVPIDYGRELTKFVDETDSITVQTRASSQSTSSEDSSDDVREESGRLLIGADGADSAVRNQMFGKGGAAPSGVIIYGENAAADLGPSYSAPEVMALRVGKRKLFCHVVTADKKAVWWMVLPTIVGEPFANERNEPWTSRSTESEILDMRQMMYDAGIGYAHGPPLPFIQNVCSDFIRYPLFTRPSVEGAWHIGKAMILGDAAHPIPPWLLDGPNLALEEATALSTLLEEAFSSSSASDSALSDALQSFYSQFEKRSQDLVSINWDLLMLSGPLIWKPVNGVLRYYGGKNVLNHLSKKVIGISTV